MKPNAKINAKVSLQVAITELKCEVNRIAELEPDPRLRHLLANRIDLSVAGIADSIEKQFIDGNVVYNNEGAPDPAQSTIAANELPRLLDFIRRASEEGKTSYLSQHDKENDPRRKLESGIAWMDDTMDARAWLCMPTVNPKDAAMVLSRINPLKLADGEDPENIYVEGDRTSPHRYRLLLHMFESVGNASPKPRTLMEWRAIAQQKNLRYHSWVDEYIAATEALTGEQSAPAAKIGAVRGITKPKVIAAFSGLHFNDDGWSRALANTPNWLVTCKVARGNKSTSATWNPALIAVALLDKGVSIRNLDAVFVKLKDWADEWEEVSALFRD